MSPVSWEKHGRQANIESKEEEGRRGANEEDRETGRTLKSERTRSRSQGLSSTRLAFVPCLIVRFSSIIQRRPFAPASRTTDDRRRAERLQSTLRTSVRRIPERFPDESLASIMGETQPFVPRGPDTNSPNNWLCYGEIRTGIPTELPGDAPCSPKDSQILFVQHFCRCFGRDVTEEMARPVATETSSFHLGYSRPSATATCRFRGFLDL